MFASGFSWFRLIPAFDHDAPLAAAGLTEHSLMPGHEVANMAVYGHAWLAAFVLIGFAVLARMALERAKARQGIERYFTADRFTILSFAEVFATGIQGLMGDLLDRRDVRLFFPLIAGLFAYIFTCNIQAIVPGFLPPTDNINTNVGMALIVLLTFVGIGLLRDAPSFIKHLMGPVWWLAAFMFPIEALSLMIRPLSLTVRLTANMFGDHQVFTILSDLIPIGLPAALLVLATLVSVIQAFVFSLLTVIYISLSLPHHEHEHEAHAHAH